MGFRHLVVASVMATALWPASSLADEASRRALALEVMALNGTADTMNAMIESTMPSVRAQIAQTGALPPAQADRLAEIFEEEFRAEMPRLMEVVAAGYAQTFTEAQLMDLKVFFETPTGRALRENTPALTQTLYAVGEQMGREVGARAFERFTREQNGNGPSPS